MNSSTIFSLYILFFRPMLMGKLCLSNWKITSFLSNISQVLRPSLLFMAIFLSIFNFSSILFSSLTVRCLSFMNLVLLTFPSMMSWDSSYESWAEDVTTVFSNRDSRICPDSVILKNTLKANLRFFAFRASKSISSGGIIWIVLWGK